MTTDSETIVAERRGLLIGARIASGTVGAAAAAVVIAAVAFLPLPTLGPDPRTVTVEPAPADQVRVCPGAAMRVGAETGDSADSVFTIGHAAVTGAVHGSELARRQLASADPAAGPEVLTVSPAEGALVGGATTVGRTTLLLLANPTEVPSRVSLEIFGEDGQVSAPGMSGIEVPANGQRVLSLAGFAPGLVSPVVHVTARGGRVAAALQHSIVRGLDAVGVETVGGGADPDASVVVPGVRIVDTVGTNRASALADWQDVGPVVRLVVPGETAGRATVRVVPETEGAVGTSFDVRLEPGTVTEMPLDAGAPEGGEGAVGDEADAHGLTDGTYTVYVDADVPLVAGVRASTAVDSGVEPAPDAILDAPASDLAWFAGAPRLDADTLVVVPDGPAPQLSIVNPTTSDVEFGLASLDGSPPTTFTVPAGGSLSAPISPGSYLVSGVRKLAIAVTFAAPGELASFVLSPARPVAGPIVVHPD